MAKGKDFRGGLNTLLKKTEPTKKPSIKKEVKTAEIKETSEAKTVLKKPRKTTTTRKKTTSPKVETKSTVTAPIKEVKDEPEVSYQTKRKRGRPKTNHKVITKTSQIGTKEGETRATFIVKEDYLEKFKALAYWERKSIKKIINEALHQYLEAKDDKMINRAMKAFKDK